MDMIIKPFDGIKMRVDAIARLTTWAEAQSRDRAFTPQQRESWDRLLGDVLALDEPVPPFLVSTLRRRGLLEGEALDDVWGRMLRDRPPGKMLLDKYGVVAGRIGDRLYLRRESKASDG